MRSSSSREVLRPALGRSNLKLLLGVEVHRLLWDGERVSGVEARRGRETVTFRARREVILCGGAFASPKLLQLSGIGDGARLGAIGVETRRHLPAGARAAFAAGVGVVGLLTSVEPEALRAAGAGVVARDFNDPALLAFVRERTAA